MANVENLKIVRMLTGEELIAEVLDENDTRIIVKNALRIVVMPSKTDPSAPTVGLAPYLQFSEDKELTLNKNCVITTASPVSDFVNQYNSVFGGLVVPNSKLIVP
jgi:hypothetical protein